MSEKYLHDFSTTGIHRAAYPIIVCSQALLLRTVNLDVPLAHMHVEVLTPAAIFYLIRFGGAASGAAGAFR
jgi:hypothetical protein